MKLQWNKAGNPAPQQSPEPCADDIKGLFRQFDAEPGQYREIARDVRALESEARWPLLSRLNTVPAPPAAPPAARVPAPAGAAPRATPFQREAHLPAPASAPNSLAAVLQRLVKAPAVAPPLSRFKVL